MKKILASVISVILLLTASFSLVGCGEPPKGQVSIKYYADGGAIVSALLSGEETIGLVPEPAATNAVKKASQQGKTLYTLDLQELYDDESKAYPQAVLMVKESVLATYPEIAQNIADTLNDNVSWVKENTATAVEKITEKCEVTTLKAPALSESAIDGCKIYYQSSTDAKQSVKNYISDIRAIDATSAKAVEDGFFYDGTADGTCAKSELSVYAPDGAPALAIAKYINDGYDFGTGLTVNYNIIANAQVPAQLVVGAYRSGNADIIVLPVNAASKFYNSDDNAQDNYKLVSVITHGNFYILSTEEIAIADLKDSRIAVPQKNAVPDWTFRSVLSKHGLEGKNIEE